MIIKCFVFLISAEIVKSIKCGLQVIGDDKYVGCFVDTHIRLLPHLLPVHGPHHYQMENNRCLLYCKDQGFLYAGTEINENCFCGDDPYQYGPDDVASMYIADFDCNNICAGDSGQICGGFHRLSVYETGLMPFEQGENWYTIVFNNTILTTPANLVLTSRSITECARYCSTSISCKVFVVSTKTGHCSLYYSFEVACNGVQDKEDFLVYLMK